MMYKFPMRKCETLHDLDILLISAIFEQDYTNIAVVINRFMNILLLVEIF